MLEIVPSIGRKVWFYQSEDQAKPYDATVIDVDDGTTPHAESLLTLFVVNHSGSMSVHPGVGLRKFGKWPAYDWMPYQRTQNEKAQNEQEAKQPPSELQKAAEEARKEVKAEEAAAGKVTKTETVQDAAVTAEEGKDARTAAAKKLEPGASPVISEDKSKHPNPKQDPMRPKT